MLFLSLLSVSYFKRRNVIYGSVLQFILKVLYKIGMSRELFLALSYCTVGVFYSGP